MFTISTSERMHPKRFQCEFASLVKSDRRAQIRLRRQFDATVVELCDDAETPTERSHIRLQRA